MVDKQYDPNEMLHMGRIVREYTKLKMHDGIDQMAIQHQLLASIERGASDYYKEVGIDDPNATQEIPAVKLDGNKPPKSAAFLAGQSFAVKRIMQEAAEDYTATRDAVHDEGIDDVLRDS